MTLLWALGSTFWKCVHLLIMLGSDEVQGRIIVGVMHVFTA